ncbi:MAG: hypothetical protein AB1646_04135 [Thermodesulfobacteriota bacterium]
MGFSAMFYPCDLDEKVLVVHFVENALGTLADSIILRVELLGSPRTSILGERLDAIPDEDLLALRDTGQILQSLPHNG